MKTTGNEENSEKINGNEENPYKMTRKLMEIKNKNKNKIRLKFKNTPSLSHCQMFLKKKCFSLLEQSSWRDMSTDKLKSEYFQNEDSLKKEDYYMLHTPLSLFF